jgi:hypothetical protein
MSAVMIPSEWLEPGAVLPVTAETVATLLAAVKSSTFTQGRAAGLEEAAKQWDGCMYESVGEDIDIGAAIRALSPTPSDAGKDDALTIARDALEEIALAGMSGSGQESEDGMRDWHARRAWEFIGIASRAKTAIDAAIAAQGKE